jgi:eukaryotic-like serine/threonine-protein kinase
LRMCHYWPRRVYIDLYAGDTANAWERIGQVEPQMRASQLLRIQFVRIDVLAHSGRAAVAAAAAQGSRLLLRAAERYAWQLDRQRLPWADAMALLIRAGVASVRGDATGAATLLTAATVALDAVDMGLFAASARRCLGGLLGGEAGSALISQADAWMASQEIRNPARMAACVVPGLLGR